jgi:hypothetical protein
MKYRDNTKTELLQDLWLCMQTSTDLKINNMNDVLYDGISSEHRSWRQVFVYMHHTECKQLRTYTWNG